MSISKGCVAPDLGIEPQSVWEGQVTDPNSLREQAKRCCTLSKITTEPEVIEQLRVWGLELAEEADKVEWNAEEENEAHSRSGTGLSRKS
jgi:hypothetical protein